MPSVTFTDSPPQAEAQHDKRYAPPAPDSRRDKIPPLPRLRSSDAAPLPSMSIDDVYKYDGSGLARRSDTRPNSTPADLSRQNERELRIARDEIDNLKKQIEQMKADVARMQRPQLVPQGQAPYRPAPVVPPGSQAPFYPPPVVQPGSDKKPYPVQPLLPPSARPWEAPYQPVPVPAVRPGIPPADRTAPPGAIAPPRVVPGRPVSPEAPKQPVSPEIPRQPVVVPPRQPGVQPLRPQDVGKANDDFAARLRADNNLQSEAKLDRKVEDLKAPFERYMQGERERLTRAMDGSSKDHPETAGNNTAWLLSQPAESLIRDFGFAAKMKDVDWYFREKYVIADENKVSDERKEQWEQVRNSASNPQDPNWEKKQGVLHEIMNGSHIAEGRRFGRMNSERGDNPVSNNKLQWQVEAAEALVKANSANVNHDFSTRAIIRGLVGNSNARGEVYLPVPEAARIKLLDAITPMSKEAGNAFLGANPKDTALATVITALERSHASRRPEEAFQTAALNKLMEFDDARGIAVLQKLSTESANTKIKDQATAQLKKLRDKIKP